LSRDETVMDRYPKRTRALAPATEQFHLRSRSDMRYKLVSVGRDDHDET